MTLNVQEYSKHLVSEIKHSFSEDVNLLKVFEGFFSRRVVLCNMTVDTFVLDAKHTKLNSGGIAEYLSECQLERIKSVESLVQKAIDIDKVDYRSHKDIYPPFWCKPFENILRDKDKSLSTKVDTISKTIIDYIHDTPSHQFELDISVTRLASCLDTVIDWKETLGGLSNLDVVCWLALVAGDTYFTLPTDTRIYKGEPRITKNVTLSFMMKHPTIKFVERLKFKGGLTCDTLYSGNNFKNEVRTYLEAAQGKVEKTRTPLCMIVQQIKQLAARQLLLLTLDNILYAPFKTVNIFPSSQAYQYLKERFESVPLAKLSEGYILKTGDKPNPFRQAITSILWSTTITDISDLPEDYPIEISTKIYDSFKKKGYSTTVGLPMVSLGKLVTEYEHQNNISEDIEFPKVKLNRFSSRMERHFDKHKLAGTYEHARGIIGDEIIEVFAAYQKTDGTKHTLAAINRFIEWCESILNGIVRFKTLHDFKPSDFHQTIKRKEGDNTFYTFIKELEVNDTTSYNHWKEVHYVFAYWANIQTFELNRNVSNPVLPPSKVFSLPRHHDSSVRKAMPSRLHEICVEVLKKDDYAIYTNSIKFESEERLRNNETGNYELVLNATIPRCLHLLFLFPMRGFQSRWLDEGLLDSHIWNIEKGCYEENTHPLANYDYGDGTTHTSRYSATGVIQSEQDHGNGSLKLYINTNKTQMKTLRMKGHTGYDIPWPYDTNIDQVDDIWSIIEEQRKFNKKYAPEIRTPVKVVDEDKDKYKPKEWDSLPYFVPLFRNTKPTNSKADKTRQGIYLPVTSNQLRKLFLIVLEEAEKQYKAEFPQFKSQNVAFKQEGDKRKPLYDIHGLRVYGVTELIEKGLPIEVVQMIVGHSVRVMTAYYNKIRAESFKKLILNAQKKRGILIENERQMIEDFENGDDSALIALFDLIAEWNDDDNESKAKYTPSFENGGMRRVVNGGVCDSFDCDTGGLALRATRNGKTHVITPLQGGKFRCGNCRYWRSGPRFLLEQIYHLNLVGEEIVDVYSEKQDCAHKVQNIYADDSLDNKHFLVERVNEKADAASAKLAYLVSELQRRELMLKASLKKSGVSEGMSLPVLAGDNDYKPDVDGTWSETSMLDACLERTTQAAVLGIEPSEDEVSMRKLDRFVAKAIDSSGKNGNPFLYTPNNEVKRVALLYVIANSQEKIGRKFTDEEFNDPRLLQKTLAKGELEELGDIFSLKNEQNLLEHNE